MSPASSWVRAKTGFTFISLARARLNCCRGQGQLGAGPQPGKVPWSGLVPSTSHQPWGGRSAEVPVAVHRCLLSVSFWKAHDSVGAGGEWGEFAPAPLQDRGARPRCKLRFELGAASARPASAGVETGLRCCWLRRLLRRRQEFPPDSLGTLLISSGAPRRSSTEI